MSSGGVKKDEGEKKSTNEKTEQILVAAYDDDDFAIKKRKAKNTLRKAVLYSSGARAIIPKVRLKSTNKNLTESPYRMLEPSVLPPEKTAVVSSVPPGVHQDIYRYVSNLTTKSYNDPERIFFTSTSMTEGVNTINQPPWYYGNNNVTKPPDGNILLSANRYGYRGSKEIQQYHVSPVQAPDITRTKYTPKFLDGNDYINEWVPPILATTQQTINNLETPKLWPQNTQYPCGYKKKKKVTSAVYKRETTVVLHPKKRPQTTEALNTVLVKQHDLREKLYEYAALESTKSCESLPIIAQTSFVNTWNNRVKEKGNNTVKVALNRDDFHCEKHTLLDETDTMRYTACTSFIVHSQSAEELKFRNRLEKLNATLPYASRWKQVEGLFRGIRPKLKKDYVNMACAIADIGMRLHREAVVLGTPTYLSRNDFLSVLTKITLFESFPQKQLNLLYSAFDPRKKNMMRYVELISCLSMLDSPNEAAISKLALLWNLNAEYGQDKEPFEMALSILLTCCSNDEEKDQIEKQFKEQFRVTCYRMSVLEDLEKLDAGEIPMIKPDSRQGSRPGTGESPTSSPNKSKVPKKKDTALNHQFNIGHDYLDENSFIRVLSKCPVLINLFEGMLRDRIEAFRNGVTATVVAKRPSSPSSTSL